MSLWLSSYGSTSPRPPHCQGFTITFKHTTLWTSDRSVSETSTWQHSQENQCPRRYSNLQFQQASGRRPTPSIWIYQLYCVQTIQLRPKLKFFNNNGECSRRVVQAKILRSVSSNTALLTFLEHHILLPLNCTSKLDSRSARQGIPAVYET